LRKFAEAGGGYFFFRVVVKMLVMVVNGGRLFAFVFSGVRRAGQRTNERTSRREEAACYGFGGGQGRSLEETRASSHWKNTPVTNDIMLACFYVQ
jgi:hypothetical protein